VSVFFSVFSIKIVIFFKFLPRFEVEVFSKNFLGQNPTIYSSNCSRGASWPFFENKMLLVQKRFSSADLSSKWHTGMFLAPNNLILIICIVIMMLNRSKMSFFLSHFCDLQIKAVFRIPISVPSSWVKTPQIRPEWPWKWSRRSKLVFEGFPVVYVVFWNVGVPYYSPEVPLSKNQPWCPARAVWRVNSRILLNSGLVFSNR